MTVEEPCCTFKPTRSCYDEKASKISRKIVIYIFTLYQAVMLSMSSVRAGASVILSYSGAAPCCPFGYCTEWRLCISCPTALLGVVLPSSVNQLLAAESASIRALSVLGAT